MESSPQKQQNARYPVVVDFCVDFGQFTVLNQLTFPVSLSQYPEHYKEIDRFIGRSLPAAEQPVRVSLCEKSSSCKRYSPRYFRS